MATANYKQMQSYMAPMNEPLPTPWDTNMMCSVNVV